MRLSDVAGIPTRKTDSLKADHLLSFSTLAFKRELTSIENSEGSLAFVAMSSKSKLISELVLDT